MVSKDDGPDGLIFKYDRIVLKSSILTSQNPGCTPSVPVYSYHWIKLDIIGKAVSQVQPGPGDFAVKIKEFEGQPVKQQGEISETDLPAAGGSG